MSNTVLILANAYEEFCNKSRVRGGKRRSNNRIIKWQELWEFIASDKRILVMSIIAIMSLVIFSISVLLKANIIFMVISIITYVLGLLGLILSAEKNEVENYRKRRKSYYQKLSSFNCVLKYEFKIDNKDKLEFILKECDQTANLVGKDIKIVKKFLTSWQNIVYPIIMIGVSIAIATDSGTNNLSVGEIISLVINILIIFCMIIMLLNSIQIVVEPFVNSNKNRINFLKSILNDIYMKEYL